MFTAAMLTSAILTMAIRVYLELSERCSVAVDEDLLPQALLSDGALQRPGALQSERLARYRRPAATVASVALVAAGRPCHDANTGCSPGAMSIG